MPTKKIGSGALAGFITVIVVWVASQLGVEVPPEVASAFTGIISIGTGYLVPEKQEQ